MPPKHESMRGYFAFELYKQMQLNPKIWLLVGDLGYAMFDYIKRDFPDRFVNVGAAEQAMIDVAVGLAYEKQIPFVYSITTFLLYRPFEGLRTYINHEKLNVKLVASGRDFDYQHDGWSHHSPDAKPILDTLENIEQYWPNEKEAIVGMIESMIQSEKPTFISLRR